MVRIWSNIIVIVRFLKIEIKVIFVVKHANNNIRALFYVMIMC